MRRFRGAWYDEHGWNPEHVSRGIRPDNPDDHPMGSAVHPLPRGGGRHRLHVELDGAA